MLKALVLPQLDLLAPEKARGAECVWCPARLSGDAVVDLGGRESGRGWWVFPRACPPCAGVAAHRALLDHRGRCEQCVDEAAECPAGHGLHRLIRACRTRRAGTR
ncbi:hypothetical protein AB0O07_17800 [Streptomyces sp. NPDC093085]|uniref:hypothetical protein n=1 Tax=Streptomyces sp. NPDC093085 TaxID=3155068 RepID=UPI0034204AAD